MVFVRQAPRLRTRWPPMRVPTLCIHLVRTAGEREKFTVPNMEAHLALYTYIQIKQYEYTVQSTDKAYSISNE